MRPKNTPEVDRNAPGLAGFPGCSQTGDGVLLQVTVKAGSKHQKVEIDEGRLLFFLRSPPAENQANKELLRMLSRLTCIGSARIRIVSGASSKHKTLLLKGVSPEDLNINDFAV